MVHYDPMLAKSGDSEILDRKTLVGYIFEPKLDGTRVLVYKDKNDIEIINRKKQDILTKYPEFLDIAAFMKTRACVLDGEVVVLNNQGIPDPVLLQQREQIKDPGKVFTTNKKQPATIFVFDILEKDGISLMQEPLSKRKIILKNLIKGGPNIILCPYTMHGKDLWKQIQKQRMEGMMAKEVNSKYMSGTRAWSWLKIKNFSTVDAAIIGMAQVKNKDDEGDNKRKDNNLSLLLALYNQGTDSFRYIGETSTNFNKKELDLLMKLFKPLRTKQSILSEEQQKAIKEKNRVTWFKPEFVAEVKSKEKFQNELKSSSFLRLRFDKDVKDCVLEI